MATLTAVTISSVDSEETTPVQFENGDKDFVEVDPASFCQSDLNSSEHTQTLSSKARPHHSVEARKIQKRLPSISITKVNGEAPAPASKLRALQSSGVTLTRVSDPLSTVLRHPRELKTLIFGALAEEMTIKVRKSSLDDFEILDDECFPREDNADNVRHKFSKEVGSVSIPKWQHGDDPALRQRRGDGARRSKGSTEENSVNSFEGEDEDLVEVEDADGKLTDPQSGAVRFKCRYV